jgi:hypothetical protein
MHLQVSSLANQIWINWRASLPENI